jgi:hypothetical protein
VQPVCQLHQKHPHILHSCEDKFLEVLRLLGLLRFIVELSKLCDAVHQFGHIGSKPTLYLV